MTEDIKYTPKQIAYKTGIGYRKILNDIKNKTLTASKDDGEQSFVIYQEDLVDYLASLDESLKNELTVSFKGKVPKDKIKEVTEELIETFNKVKDKHSIPLSLNIESK